MSRGNAVIRGTPWIHTSPLAFGNQKDVEPVFVNGNFQTPIISHFIVPTEAACVSRSFADPHYCSAMNSRMRSNFFPSAIQQRMVGLLKSFHRLDSYTPWSILSKTLSHSTFSFQVTVPLECDTLIVLSRVHSSLGINLPSTKTSDVPRALNSTYDGWEDILKLTLQVWTPCENVNSGFVGEVRSLSRESDVFDQMFVKVTNSCFFFFASKPLKAMQIISISDFPEIPIHEIHVAVAGAVYIED